MGTQSQSFGLGTFATGSISVQNQDILRVVAADDLALAAYFDFLLGATYTAIKPKVGDLRIQDADDVDESDYLQFTVDDALGKVQVNTPVVGVGPNPLEFLQKILLTLPATQVRGTLLAVAFGAAVTLAGGPTIGCDLDLSTNVTLNGQDIIGLRVAIPPAFGAGAEIGLQVLGGGYTVNIADGGDACAAYTTDGTRAVLLSDGTHSIFANDAIHVSMIAKTSGTILETAWSAGVTLLGPTIGLNLDLLTNVTLNAQNVTGLQVLLPAAYAAGNEYAVHATGGGGTFDALYSAGAAAITGAYISDGTRNVTLANATNAIQVGAGNCDFSVGQVILRYSTFAGDPAAGVGADDIAPGAIRTWQDTGTGFWYIGTNVGGVVKKVQIS